MSSAAELVSTLKEAVEALDRPRAAEICDEIATLVELGEPISPRHAKGALNALRGKRYFSELARLGAALTMDMTDAKVRRLYAQGLIEAGQYAVAAGFLRGIVHDPETDPDEVEEAHGLLGRISKQRYVNLGPEKAPMRADLLLDALARYRVVYDEAPDSLWHAANVVALLARAERDELDFEPDIDYRDVAEKMLELVEDKGNDANAWDFASGMEAAIALDEKDTAVKYAERYARMAAAMAAGPFEYGSTLRQLREVWGAAPDNFIGERIVPLLEAVMVDAAVRDSEGGGVEMSAETVRLIGTPEGVERFEKVFEGQDRYVRIEWITLIQKRSMAIGKVKQMDGKGVGTGFILKGSTLNEALGDDWYFLTNSHVITNDEEVRALLPGEKKPLLPEEASVMFQMLFNPRRGNLKLGDIVWTSPPSELDATLLRLGEPFYDDEPVEPIMLGPEIPDPADRPRLYIIGYPGGKDLSVSIHDNHLLERDDTLMRYRTPTNPGSSGSPVFDKDWRLVGLHHAGSGELPGLDDPSVMVEANEGIRIDAIVEAIKEFLASAGGPELGLQGG